MIVFEKWQSANQPTSNQAAKAGKTKRAHPHQTRQQQVESHPPSFVPKLPELRPKTKQKLNNNFQI
jgi:hypothetical protein